MLLAIPIGDSIEQIQIVLTQCHEIVTCEDAGENGQMGYEGGSVVGSYSMGLETQVNLRMNTKNGNRNSNSNLVRQTSSPAGFFQWYLWNIFVKLETSQMWRLNGD